LNRDELAGTLSNSETDAFRYYYLALETLMLDGPSLVGLINMQSAGDLQAFTGIVTEIIAGDPKISSD